MLDAGNVPSLGPFFDVQRHESGAEPIAPWRSMAELLDAAVLRDRVGQVRAALAQAGQRPIDEVELRVAASVMHLGLVARLVSPVLAEAALSGRPVPPGLSDWWWQPQVTGTFPMSLPAGRGPGADQATVAAIELLDGPVANLTTIVSDHFGVSRRVLWGNVASALNATRGLIAATGPDAAGRIDLIVNSMRKQPGLTGEDAAFGPDFRRRSCCLIYRLAPDRVDAVCGDCVLRRPRDAESASARHGAGWPG
jgi:FhuF 2Fe-2S C-terminal domain